MAALNPSQLSQLLAAMFAARLPILVTGAPGIGKTDVTDQARAAAKMDLILTHPSVGDPTDYKGLPWPGKDGKSAHFIPFGEFHRALNCTAPTVWFFDDLGQASPSVQAACMQLFLARRVNGHILPDCVTFAAATNRRIDRANVSGILEPVKSRFVTIVELLPEIESWCQWAINHGISYTLIAFLRYRDALLSAFAPSADLTNSPMPRTWANLAKLEALNLPDTIESAAFAGAVGDAAATEYLVFRRMVKQLVNLDAILLDPAHAAIPKTKPDQLYAIAVALAGKANPANFGCIVTYCDRLMDADRGEFAVLCIRDAYRRDQSLQHTDTFIKLNCSPLGSLINGATKGGN